MGKDLGRHSWMRRKRGTLAKGSEQRQPDAQARPLLARRTQWCTNASHEARITQSIVSNVRLEASIRGASGSPLVVDPRGEETLEGAKRGC